VATTIFTEMTELARRTGALNLGQGFPDEDGPAVILDAAVDALRTGHNQYAPLPGVPDLRQAVADHQRRHYSLEVDPDTEVQVTFGATEAIAAALLALVRPGDEVLTLDPSYDSYGAIVELAGGRAIPVELDPPDWRVPEVAPGPAARALLLNSPHNPTGRVLDDAELERLAQVCRERDLIVITDEVYEHLVYDGRHVPLATLPGMWERTLTVSSLGKTHSLTGWKVGWVSGPAQLVARVREVKQFLSFAGGTPLQQAAAAGLAVPADELARSLRAKRDRLGAGLRDAGFEVLPTAGTYFLNADAKPLGYADAAELCRELPHEAGVVAIPISAFSTRTEGAVRSIVRFAFCKRDEVLDDAIARLRAWAK
jgi:N-succinyldiaminopimelate aminotransferase